MAWQRKETPLQRRLRIKARHYKYRWFYRIVLPFVLLVGFVVGGVGTYWYVTTPKLSDVFVSSKHAQLFKNQVNIRYLSSDNHVFYQTNQGKYTPVKLSEIKKSRNLVNALTAIEDRDFFKEGGVNWGHTAKAGLDTAMRHGVSGGSTITQQLIKLTFFSTARRDQTVKRKFQEIVLAERLNRQFSKDQILTWYFNRANFGNGQQGIVAASKYYYGKKPSQLDPLEAATLVGIINSPATYNPYLNVKATTYRRNLVLKSMQETGALSKGRAQKLIKTPLTANLIMAKRNVEGSMNQRLKQLDYAGFVSAANAQMNRYNNQVLTTDVNVKTTMNQKLQDQVDSIVKGYKFPDDKIQEAIVVINNQTGQVVAMSGGRNTTVLGGYNRAFNAKRSTGSSIKPLLDFGPGMELYHWTGDTMVDDSSYKYPGTNQEVNDWDNQHQGRITLRQALVQSRNVPAVKALVQVGLPNGKKVLKALGLPSQNLFYANAIGVDTNPLALSSAYTALANGGQRSNARFIDQVDNGRKTLKMQTVHEQVYSPQTAYLLTKILQGVFGPTGTASKAKLDNVAQAGKTGTVGRDDKKDALTDSWMAGYTKTYTVCVWVGYDNPYDQKDYLNNQKAEIAIDLYKQVMQKATELPGDDHSDWKAPAGVSGNGYSQGVDTTSNDFLNVNNQVHTYVPFYLNMMPQNFLDNKLKHRDDSSWRQQLYDHVNEDGQS